MSGTVEVGTCSVCKKEKVPVNRKYYYYDIECLCCNRVDDDHFEIVYHCTNCEPKPPRKVSCSLNPLEEDEAFKPNTDESKSESGDS